MNFWESFAVFHVATTLSPSMSSSASSIDIFRESSRLSFSSLNLLSSSLTSFSLSTFLRMSSPAWMHLPSMWRGYLSITSSTVYGSGSCPPMMLSVQNLSTCSSRNAKNSLSRA